MTDSVAGLVVVVAGSADPTGTVAARVNGTARALQAAGALVAVLSPGRHGSAHPVAFDGLGERGPTVWRVDPTDPGVWQRIGAHIEQRLGPIDAVVAAADVVPVVTAALADDFHRRGHGGVAPLPDPAEAVRVVSELVRTRR